MEQANLLKMFAVDGLMTVSFLPLVLYLFNIQENYYNIGKYQNLPLIAALICGEIMKAIYNYIKFNHSFDKDNPVVRNKKTSSTFTFREIFRMVLINLGMVGVFYILSVLFGAPVFLKQEETLMFSILLTILTVLPACLYLGTDSTLLLISNFNSYYGSFSNEIVLLSMRLTVFGAWLGAVAIPLDWDRPWQEWPIPCCLGAIVGYTFSQLIMVLLRFPGLNKLLTKSGKFIV